MVAYSYKRRFVAPIRAGLEVHRPEFVPTDVHPKRQTIRADRKRHVRPGEEIQHYCGMRTKGCFLIGRATCLDVQPIAIRFARPKRKHSQIYIPGKGLLIIDREGLDAFAKDDGFGDWSALHLFWNDNHPGVTDFDGVLITWKPKG